MYRSTIEEMCIYIRYGTVSQVCFNGVKKISACSQSCALMHGKHMEGGCICFGCVSITRIGLLLRGTQDQGIRTKKCPLLRSCIFHVSTTRP